MPVGFDSDIKRLEGLYEAFPEEITVRPELNGRHEKPDVEWLINSILEHGQIQAVGIWKDGETAVLAYGFSRWRAFSLINERKLTPAPLKIRCTLVKVNEQGAFIRNISENRQRNAVSPVDDAHNISRLIEIYQMDQQEIAKIYFPTAVTADELKEAVKFVQGRIDLIRLSPESERAVQAGRLDETAAAAIAKLSSALQKKALKKEGKVTVKDIKAVKPAKTAKPKVLRIDPELRRRIEALIETADFESYDERKTVWISVHAEQLAALKNYITPEK